MNCPTCGGEAWDNAARVAKGWKGPIAKCQDQSCGWVKWPPKPPKGQGGQGQGGGGHRGAGGQRGGNTRPLGPLYADCLRLAIRITKGEPAIVFTSDNLLNMTATIFIAASRDGTALVPPPPPKPKPVMEEEDYAVPDDQDDSPY